MPSGEARVILRVAGIRKRFGGVTALDGVDLVARAGEVHGLVGANGAGKSTLVKIVNGVYRPDEGELEVDGRPASFASPREAREAGIAMVYQEFSLIPTLSVAQNIQLGREPRNRIGLTDETELRRSAARILGDLGVAVDPDAPVGRLPVGVQQLVEIAKATSVGPSLLVLDEPTASLSQSEVEALFATIRRLCERGVAIIYISHHLAEVRKICRRITVLRDGRTTLSGETAGFSLDAIIEAMTGRVVAEVAARAAPPDASDRPPVVELRGWSLLNRLHGIDLSIRPGEIVGVAGLLGSGRTSLLRSIAGLEPAVRGEMRVAGRPVRITSPAAAASHGIAFVPEDRRREGIITGQSVQANHLLSTWGTLTRRFLVDERAALLATRSAVDRFGIRTSGPAQAMEQLSGGNQQKVVVARALARSPSLLLLDDPTTGIDIASRRELLGHLRDYADAGGAALIVSSELDELGGIAGRVLILSRGRVVRQLDRAAGEVLSESLLHAALHAPDAHPGHTG